MLRGFFAFLSILAFVFILATPVFAEKVEIPGVSKSDLRKATLLAKGNDRLLRSAIKSDKRTIKSLEKIDSKAGVNNNPADYDFDGDTDDVDQLFMSFCQQVRRMIPVCTPADLSGDGVINLGDVVMFARYYAASNGTNDLPGDFDGDLDVDQDDANFFGDCYSRTQDGVPIPDICEQADLNDDGVINLTDLSIMVRNMLRY